MYICGSGDIIFFMLIGAEIIKGALRLLALQPLKLHYFWGKCISWILRVPMRYRRDVVMVNLSRSFPEKKYKELAGIADGFYAHFGRILAETVWFAGSVKESRLLNSGICRIVNMDLLSAMYEESPGVMIMTSHLGNWEIIGGFMHYPVIGQKLPVPFGEKDITVVYKALNSPVWDKVMRENRCAPVKVDMDSCCVESRDIMRFVIDHRHEKRIYIFPTDQAPYKYASYHTVDNFMHQPTKTMTGGASLARKLKLSVCYMGMTERPEGGYDIRFQELCRDASQSSVEELMNGFYACLARDIEAQPWNYLWSHKRWKK